MKQHRPTIDEQIQYIDTYVASTYWRFAIIETLEKYQQVKAMLERCEVVLEDGDDD